MNLLGMMIQALLVPAVAPPSGHASHSYSLVLVGLVNCWLEREKLVQSIPMAKDGRHRETAPPPRPLGL
jgi:hypothetical protein